MTRVSAVIAGLLVVVLGYVVARTYVYRLSDHHGNHLVAVDDPEMPIMAELRPRHAVFIVVDGLRADAALQTRAARYLRDRGTCMLTDVGELTLSRPVYTELSTGVEVARTGVRSNDDVSPSSLESIWQVARRHGLRVHGASAVSWWIQLFPDGFDDFRVLDGDQNPFASIALSDLTLIHPGTVDDAGHQAGAAGKPYADAVARVDQEMTLFLQRLDFGRDLVIMTADHGHTMRGGHGGSSPELRHVLTCMAGRGIRQLPSRLDRRLDARSLPALLSIIEQLPFPRQLAAGDDDIDMVFDIVDPSALPAGQIEARREALAIRRQANARQLQIWLGTPHASWKALAARDGTRQLSRFFVALAVVCLGLLALLRITRRSWREALVALLWSAIVLTLAWLAVLLETGRFDFASSRLRTEFVEICGATFLLITTAASIVHLALFRDGQRLLRDGVALVGVVCSLLTAHIVGLGWSIGFPLPHAALLFMPYALGVFLSSSGLWLVGAGMVLHNRRLRRFVER
jgi:hypothetical protein